MGIVDKKKFAFTLVFIATIVVLLCGFCQKQLFKATVTMATAQRDTLEATLSLQGFFFYDENVVYGTEGGTLAPAYDDYTKVGVGAKVGEFTSASADLTADYTTAALYSEYEGLLLYSLDGYENILTAAVTDSMEPSAIAALLDRKTNSYTTYDRKIYSGSALYKIIKNTANLTYGAVFPREYGADLAIGEEYTLSFGEKTVNGSLTELRLDDDYGYGVFTFQSNDDFFYENRCVDCTLVLSSVAGVSVATSALTEVDGDCGVYVSNNGVVEFLPLTILGENGDSTIVEGLEAGDFYIKNPKFCKNGKILT